MINNYNMKNNIILASSISGLIEVSITQPLDVIKTKLQEYSLNKSRLSFRKSLKIISSESNFYRGYTPRLIGIIPMRTIYWSLMTTLHDHIPSNMNYFKKSISIGSIVGITQTLIDCPIQIMKIKMQTNNSLNLFDSMKKIKYQGFVSLSIRNSVFASSVNYAIHYKKHDNHMYNFGVCALGGLIGSIISQPFDVRATELQREHKLHKPLSFLKFMQQNPKILWSGGLTRSTMGFINMGIGGMTFLFLKKFID